MLIVLGILVAAALVATSFVLYSTINTQGELHFENDSSPRAFFPMSHGMIEMFDSTLFLVDTGSSFSTINRSTLERLKAMGMDVKYSSMPIIGRGNDNKMHVSTGHYTVTLPIAQYKLRLDSISRSILWLPTGQINNYIKNVNFVLTDDSNVNTLGMDILEDFILEYQYFRQALALRTKVEENYQELADLTYPILWENLYGSAHRYYIPISVDNGKTFEYLIDTGINRLCLKMPLDESLGSKRPLTLDRYFNGQSVDVVRSADDAWIKIGRRAGSHKVYYAPINVEARSFNPLLFFSQDAAFDFREKKIYLRPYAMLGFPRLPEDTVTQVIKSYYEFINTSDD